MYFLLIEMRLQSSDLTLNRPTSESIGHPSKLLRPSRPLMTLFPKFALGCRTLVLMSLESSTLKTRAGSHSLQLRQRQRPCCTPNTITMSTRLWAPKLWLVNSMISFRIYDLQFRLTCFRNQIPRSTGNSGAHRLRQPWYRTAGDDQGKANLWQAVNQAQ
jgi:hypothetical protein